MGSRASSLTPSRGPVDEQEWSYSKPLINKSGHGQREAAHHRSSGHLLARYVVVMEVKVLNVGGGQGFQGGRDLKVVIKVVKVGNMVNME